MTKSIRGVVLINLPQRKENMSLFFNHQSKRNYICRLSFNNTIPMKTHFNYSILHHSMAIIAIILLTSFNIGTETKKPANTSGTVVFTATTLPAGGNYSPKHVLAIWIEKDGAFVKTRKAMANQRRQYLYKWAASSNYNVTDAITGATLTQHQTHAIAWDCKDINGNIVPDGEYKMIIEFTDKHAQGPYYEVTFYKGTEPVAIMPPNQQYIINMYLSYEPEITVAANFSANITEACQEEEVVFTDNSTGATTWYWSFGVGSSPATATAQGPHTVTYSTTGPKTVSLTVNGTVTETKNGYININPLPSAGFTTTQNENVVGFNNTSQNASTYFWDFGDGTTSTEVSPTHEYLENGEFTVTLTATSDECGNDSYSEIIYITGVGLPERGLQHLDIYPNPSSGLFNVALSGAVERISVKMIDIRGNVVYEMHQPGSTINGRYVIEDHNLSPGIYLVEIFNGNQYFRRKLIFK
jgi:PKD repeat protein